MAENSFFWTTDDSTPEGDQVSSYSQAHWSTAAEIMAACSGFEGVAPGYKNGLAGTVSGANTVAINTGGACVDGKIFINDASQDVNIPSSSGGTTRIDRIVLRATWASFNVSVYRIAGVESGGSPSAPAITQTSGTTYDIMLYQALVNSSGTVTLTDERVFAVEIDETTITHTAGVLKIKDDGVDSDQIAAGAIDLAHMSANSVDSDQYVDGSIDAIHLADDIVDDTKVGNRVPQYYRRQGGSATSWYSTGSTDYTPTTVRMQSGAYNVVTSQAIVFPVAFSYTPIILVSSGTGTRILSVSSVTASGFTINVWDEDGVAATAIVLWLAIGPE